MKQSTHSALKQYVNSDDNGKYADVEKKIEIEKNEGFC